MPEAPITYLYDANRRELTLAGAGSSVLVKNFDDGELGIRIPGAPAPAPAPAPVTQFDLSTSQGRYDWSTRYRLPQTDNWSVFNANASGLGNIMTAGGDDLVIGGAALVGRQTFLSGGAGRDQVFSGAQQTLAQAIASGDQQAATGRGVYMLAGDDGDDLVVGAGDDDALFGGRGNDTLVGGAGGDIIFADGNNDYAQNTADPSWITGSNNAQTAQRRQLALITTVALRGTTDTTSTRTSYSYYETLPRYIDPLAETDLSGLLAMRRQDIPLPLNGVESGYIEGTQRSYADLTGGAWFGTNIGQGNDVIHAGAGDDVVNAGGGNDLIDAGTGTTHPGFRRFRPRACTWWETTRPIGCQALGRQTSLTVAQATTPSKTSNATCIRPKRHQCTTQTP